MNRFLALFLLPTLLNAAEPNPVSGAGSDLPADQKALFGSMDNGFHYIIYPNAEPPGRFSVRLHIAAGSLMENDDQRGLAHFLEHMVFNGSRNFTSAELIPKMQRLGIAFGAHANAYTSFDETVYMLDLPNLQEDTKDLAFTVMRDFADGALLNQAEIDKERGVIIAEKTSRDSVSYRMMVDQYSYLLPESRLANRLPIGDEKVIREAQRERFTDFYTRYYTPANMTFVVVGDIDPKEMEKRVRETFISMANPENPGEVPAPDIPPSDHGFQTAVFTDPELPGPDLTLYSLRPYTPELDTAQNRQKHLPLTLANQMLSRRFEILSKKEDSPILSGSAGRSILFNQMEIGSVDVTPESGKWPEATAVLETELRRAVEHGFTEAELQEATAEILNAAEQAVKRASTRESASIASSIAGAVNDSRVFTTPETNLEVLQNGLKDLKPDTCHAAFKEFWATPDRSLVLSATSAPEGTDEKLKSLWEESAQKEVVPPEEIVALAFAYTDFGPAGEVTEKSVIEDLGITQLTLSNGVKVNLKPTDFEKNSVRLLARVGSGNLTMPKDKPGLDKFAGAIFEAGGLGKHTADELQRLMAGKNVVVGFGVNEDAFTLGGRATPNDLKLELQLMTAYLTDPAYRPEAVRQFQKMLPMVYSGLEHSLQGGMAEMDADLHGGDPRFVIPPQEKALSYSAEDVKTWLTPALEKAPIELSLVGDFKVEETLPLILETFGALPARDTEKPDLAEARKVTFPKVPAEKTIKFESVIPNAAAIAAWPIPDATKDIAQARRFNLLAAIFSNRLREEIREKLGGSYSPYAGAAPSQILEFGIFQSVSQVKPEETEKYGKLMVSLADELSKSGVTEDELDRALKPVISNLNESLRDNGYWLGTVLSRSQEDPKLLKWARERDQDYTSITVEELNELAKQYLPAKNALLYQIVPEAKAGE